MHRLAVALACSSLLVSASAAGQTPTFKASTHLVQVSVVVQDKSKEPVKGLQADDFQIFENGTEVPVSFFSVRSDTSPNAAPSGGDTFSNRLQTSSNGGVVAIVYDLLNTEVLDQSRVREHVIKYLSQVSPDDRIGLYVLDGQGIHVLHDFTRDARSLLRVLAGTQSTFNDLLEQNLADFAQGAEGNLRSFFERRRAFTSVEALELVAKHLRGVPGRKNLV